MAFEQIFEDGVKSFQAKDYPKAVQLFNEALVLQPNNSHVLTNMALTQYELGRKIEAYVYFKKATLVDPQNIAAQQGFDFISSQIQVRDIPHQIELYERARGLLVQPLPSSVPYFLTWLFLVVLGIRWVQHIARRRRAYFSGEDTPTFGALNWVLSFFLVLFVTWTVFYNYDQSIERAFVKSETVSLRSAPSIGSPAILDLYGGLEVRVLRRQQDWIQVQYPGSYSGWLPKDSLVEL